MSAASGGFDHFVGTRTVSGQHAFDVAALESWMSAHVQDFKGPITVEMFKGGQSNPTYKLITPTQAYVMRAKPGPVAKLLPSAHAVEREFAVMRGLAGTEVPVPKMHALCEDETVIGRAFYIMEFVAGRVLWDQSLPGMTPDERGEIYREMNRVQAALHTVDFGKQGLAGYGKPGNYFERQIGRWSKQYLASVTQPIVEMDKLIEWLPANIPTSARDESKTSIVHGDYRLDNLMFHARARCARLGAVHAGPSTRRFQLPLHGLAHPPRRVSRHRGLISRRAGHPQRERLHCFVLPAHKACHTGAIASRLAVLLSL
jgi:aminoglycoside phosphotransferase (APT) family kinase protein